MPNLSNKRVAVLVCDGFEEAELTEPTKALCEAGATVEIVSQKAEPLQAFQHHKPTTKVNVDKTFSQVSPEDYDAVLLPGGALNSDELRTDADAQEFVKQANDEGKPIAVICHAPWILASTGIARGRKLTSRGPHDLPAFNRAMCELFAR